ncbi:hypothetical protein NEOLEDRAFT_1238132 [Neolentinus lepideus HHB14362 ss-1]|uniref:F-box domain-containing protein n=1 Tax=Neolentinus lepideus HHB14362 ss-1 TaxID=1314782 RepID=A0A165WC36_9AGAM|nr:hypothetical protein NEOLEDRAFT_1238132 [Neolentinus lepideus HHB14362 ss-1]
MVRLPDELWAQIWECIPVHETPMKIPFPFVATWVCTSWRRIALGTPCLWGNVRISIKFPVQLLKLQLERCLPCCITIELDLLWGPWTGHKIQYRSEDKLALAISLLSNNVERCRAFELRAVCFDVDGVDTYRWLLKEIMRPLITARAPHLERLYIQCPEEDHPGPLFAGGIPRLTDLTLLATQCTTYLPLLHGLVSLELSCIPHGNALTPSDFQNTLAACPNLTHLAIRNQCITYDHLEGRALILPFHLPSLVSLSVELHHVDRHFARHFFEGFSAPHLESLHLHHFQWESYRAFVVAMCKDPTPRFPNLSKLSLFDVDILHTVLDQQSRNYCLKLLLCFPSIKELVIHTYDPGDSEFLHLLATHRKELLCPKLCSLSWLRQFPLEHEESLLRGLISSRALLGSPIFKLSYFRDAFADLDSETQDWLHQNTRVELRNPVAFVEDL